jgi:tRNA1Val (adenine37-N6)-methyltransferase
MKPFTYHNVILRRNESIDSFMDGRLKLIQSKDGYRFSIDAVLLSEFVTIKQGDVILDLGTGCGVILLLLLMTKSIGYTLGLEIQKELASQAERNASLNGFEDRMGIILGDIKHPPIAKRSVDVVICNPPYRRVKSGRINPDPRKAVARHELMASIDDILDTSAHVLKGKGRVAIVYPAVRFIDIVARLRHFNLEPKKMRIIYPDPGSEASLVLIEACMGARPGIKIEPPVFGQGNWDTI